MLNSRDLDKLRPDVAKNCQVFLNLCKKAGYPVLVTGTVRDDEYQLECYHKGTGGRPPATFHSVKAGLAFDICKNVKGEEYTDPGFWNGVSAIGKKIGFTWGGDWEKFVDKPHFQWDEHEKYRGADIIIGRYPPTMPLYLEEEKMTEQEVKSLVVQMLATQKPLLYRTLKDIPSWGHDTVEKLMKSGALNGSDGALNLSYDQLRILVINDRLGVYDK